MKTRQEKIVELTRYELVFVSEYPEWLDDASKFFADGGFNSYTDKNLNEQYQDLIEEEGVEA
jgi:hypothetical protein